MDCPKVKIKFVMLMVEIVAFANEYSGIIFFPPLCGCRMQGNCQRMSFYWCRMSRQAPGCTHPLHWELGTVSPRLQQTHMNVELRLRIGGANLHSPIYLHGVSLTLLGYYLTWLEIELYRIMLVYTLAIAK
jgi:hypothetical protein